jgi:hypothetical protein
MVQILRFSPQAPRSADWSQREIAEFYRVESALTQAGVALDIERGLTDEGDPWFAFCRKDNGEVFVHFARIDGEYIIDGAGFVGVARGRDFSVLVRGLISGEALQLAKLRPANNNVFLHPAALLIALVGAAFFHSGEAKAADSVAAKVEARRAPGAQFVLLHRSGEALPVGLDAAQAATVMAGVLIGIDEQRMLPGAPEMSSSATPAPMTIAMAMPAIETAASPTTRAAVVTTASTATPGEAQLFAAHAAAIPANLISSAQAGGDLAKLAGLILAAAPPNVALAEFSAAAPPPPVADRPYFIAADSNALPADEAGQVVRDLSTGSDPHPISLSDRLPAMIVDLIQKGSHASPAPPTPPPLAAIPTNGEPANPTAAGAAPTAPVAPPAPALPSPHDLAIDAAVTAFMNTVSHWSLVVSGPNLVLYDPDIFTPHSVDLASETFTYADGSSISLVGTAPELANIHLLH